MYRIALCDDDKRLMAQMDYFFKMNTDNVEFKPFIYGEDLLEAIYDGAQFDIIIIGNMLKKLNGIMVAKEIRRLGIKSYLIFISGIECFYYDAFEVEAFRFMKKPIDWKKFRICIQMIIEKLNDNNRFFFYKKDNIIYKLPIKDVLFFESCRRVINIVTENGTSSYYDRLDLVEEYIRNKNFTFLRIHKSYLVNSSKIEQYEYSKIRMPGGLELPISENKRNIVRNEYMEFIDNYVCGYGTHTR